MRNKVGNKKYFYSFNSFIHNFDRSVYPVTNQKKRDNAWQSRKYPYWTLWPRLWSSCGCWTRWRRASICSPPRGSSRSRSSSPWKSSGSGRSSARAMVSSTSPMALPCMSSDKKCYNLQFIWLIYWVGVAVSCFSHPSATPCFSHSSATPYF